MGTVLDAASLDPNKVSPGLLGFIIVVIIGLVTWFLAKSMAKQLRKLDADRPEEEGVEAGEPQQDGVVNTSAAPKNSTPKNTASNNAASNNTASNNTASNGAH